MMAVLLIVLFAPLIVCWGLWLLFAVLAALPSRASPIDNSHAAGADALRIDILIPAHDEELLLPRLLATLNQQTDKASIHRVLVIADHCSDCTADLARHAGATVLERSSGPRGKPAALREGLAWLKESYTLAAQPRAVLILDADCTVSLNLVAEIAGAMARGNAVVQTAYRLESIGSAQKLAAPATIAFALKNVVRPTGMARLGIPTQLFGTGMCFRSDVLDTLTFDDHLTEDLKISHDLLLAGIPPKFVARAVVSSPLPAERKAMTTQKLRWETGQIQTWAKLPAMLFKLIARARIASILALIDWSAPPLAMAVVYWGAMAALTALLVMFKVASVWMLALPAGTIVLLVLYVILGSLQTAGAAATARLFLGVPRFFFWKLALYGRMATGKGARSWQKTERGAEALPPDPTTEARP